MALTLAFGIYFVVWWITLFIVLPFGIKTQEEAQSVVPGTAASAPSTPMMMKKLLATTLISAVIFAVIYWILTNPAITLDSFPLLPKF